MKDPAFFETISPSELIDRFGSPLYVYHEKTFRARARELSRLCSYPRFKVQFSVKANANLSLLRMAREEGLWADAMSPGEIFLEEKAGFHPDEIFYIANNVSAQEMAFARDRGITVSLDSLSQLELYGKHFPKSPVSLRVNTGIGAGHSQKVITGGSRTKFAIQEADLPEAFLIARRYDLSVIGLNQHIGSFFLTDELYLESVQRLLDTALSHKAALPSLSFLDFGGGFGIPYEKSQQRLPLDLLGSRLDALFFRFAKEFGRELLFKIEPGRYLTAECGVLLGTVHALKTNSGTRYIGTDIGFNTLLRPVLYDAYHEIELYPGRAEGAPHLQDQLSKCALSRPLSGALFPQTVVGNICESGDILAKDRYLPLPRVSDILCVCDAGAYGYSMASIYNARLRPAEVLLPPSGDPVLIRRRESLEDLLAGYQGL